MSRAGGREAAPAAVEVDARDQREQVGERTVKASYPDHVWNVDLRVIPTRAGFWTMLSLFSWLQRWPFCYWLAVVVDHFSRRAVGFVIFLKRPTAKDVNAFLGRTITAVGKKPRYVITDKGKQFWCGGFRVWCGRWGIRPRFGAVGKYGSIAVVERFLRSMKNECCRRILVPMQVAKLRVEVSLYFVWFNGRSGGLLHLARRGRDEISKCLLTTMITCPIAGARRCCETLRLPVRSQPY